MNYYKLVRACKEGDLVKVKQLVASGVPIDLDPLAEAPLGQAAENGHLMIVKYLVSWGADVSDCDHWAVRIASGKGHIEIVKYLVSKGADVTASANDSIDRAARNHDMSMIKYLISVGANPTPAVYIAITKGYYELLHYLISSGFDISVGRDRAFINGVRRGYIDPVKHAVSLGCNVTQCGFMRHPARIAERIGCLDIFRFLVNVVIEEMKKYTVLKLLNQNKVIHKDLIGLVTKEIIRYAKDYHIYQRKSLVRK